MKGKKKSNYQTRLESSLDAWDAFEARFTHRSARCRAVIDKRCRNSEASSEDFSLALGEGRGAENKGQFLTEPRCRKRSDCLCHLEKGGSGGSA